MAEDVQLVDHPLVQHKLSLMRRAETPSADFRRLLREISVLLAYELTRDLPLTTERIETPMGPMDAPVLSGRQPCLVSILRAGTGLLDGMLDLMPNARVAHIGLYRDENTLRPVEYYFKAPADMADRPVIVVDPMLATGNTASAAIARLKGAGVKRLKFCCLLAAPEGVATLQREHPGVPIVTAAVDERLNDQGYIVPGLGDAGDRIFGTK